MFRALLKRIPPIGRPALSTKNKAPDILSNETTNQDSTERLSRLKASYARTEARLRRTQTRIDYLEKQQPPAAIREFKYDQTFKLMDDYVNFFLDAIYTSKILNIKSVNTEVYNWPQGAEYPHWYILENLKPILNAHGIKFELAENSEWMASAIGFNSLIPETIKPLQMSDYKELPNHLDHEKLRAWLAQFNKRLSIHLKTAEDKIQHDLNSLDFNFPDSCEENTKKRIAFCPAALDRFNALEGRKIKLALDSDGGLLVVKKEMEVKTWNRPGGC